MSLAQCANTDSKTPPPFPQPQHQGSTSLSSISYFEKLIHLTVTPWPFPSLAALQLLCLLPRSHRRAPAKALVSSALAISSRCSAFSFCCMRQSLSPGSVSYKAVLIYYQLVYQIINFHFIQY